MRKLTALFALSLALSMQAQQHVMTVDVSKPTAKIQPEMYGIFFEDINFGADGGLYAELVKNRSFEFPQPFVGWVPFGNVTVQDANPCFDRNPHYVRVVNDGRLLRAGLDNEGYRGIGVKQGEEYRFSVYARTPDAKPMKLSIELVNSNAQNLLKKEIEVSGNNWQKLTAVLKSPFTDAHARLRIVLETQGTVDMDHISLFPVNTWKGRENGLRADLAQALYDLNPGVFRFPGGCIIEGNSLETRYQWKNSVGPVENRPLNENRWNYTFKHKAFPDYFQTLGLGYFEYFLLSEDLGAEPLPVISCGLSCQYESNEVVPMDELDLYIQDALDLIEFANGGTDTKWGKLRADMGHPAPFNMKFIGIGNEQWGPEYPERLKLFVEALRKAHPEIKIIGSSGPNSEGKDFDYLWPEMKKLKVDLVDEHFYRPENWFLKSGNRYDNYDRKGPKVFAGEYACHGKGKKWNHFHASLLEAAFLTGVERNADVVHMATYAPLLAHVEGWQWRPDLIWFDNLRSVRTCSWYVQSLYGHNTGTNVVPLTMDKKPVSGQEGQNGLFASAVWDENTQTYIVKVANVSEKAQPISLEFKGLKKSVTLGDGKCITLHTENPDAENTLDNPNLITPKESSISIEGNTLNTEIGAMTFAVYKFKKESK